MRNTLITIAISLIFATTAFAAFAEPHRYLGKGGKAGGFELDGRTVSAEEFKADSERRYQEDIKRAKDPKVNIGYYKKDGDKQSREEYIKERTERHNKKIKEIDNVVRDHQIEMHKEIRKFKQGKRKNCEEFLKLKEAYEAERKANGALPKELRDEAERRLKLDKKIKKIKAIREGRLWLRGERDELEKLEREVEAELAEE